MVEQMADIKNWESDIRLPRGKVNRIPKPIRKLGTYLSLAAYLRAGSMANPNGKDIGSQQIPRPISQNMDIPAILTPTAEVNPDGRAKTIDDIVTVSVPKEDPSIDLSELLNPNFTDSFVKVPLKSAEQNPNLQPVDISIYEFGADIKAKYFSGEQTFQDYIQNIISESQKGQKLTPDEQTILSSILNDSQYTSIISGFDTAINQVATLQKRDSSSYGKLFAYGQDQNALVTGGIIVYSSSGHPEDRSQVTSFFVPEADGGSMREIPVPQGKIVDLSFLKLANGSSELVVVLEDPQNQNNIQLLVLDGGVYKAATISDNNSASIQSTPSFDGSNQLAKFNQPDNNGNSSDTNAEAVKALKQTLINEGAVFINPNPNITNVKYVNAKKVGQEISQFTIDGKTITVIKNNKNAELDKKLDIQTAPGQYAFSIPGIFVGISGVRVIPEASVSSSDGHTLTIQNLQMVDFMMLSDLYDTNYLIEFEVPVDEGVSFRMLGDDASQIDTKTLINTIKPGSRINILLYNGFDENSNTQQQYIDEIFKNFNNQIPDNLKNGTAALSLVNPAQIDKLWALYYKRSAAGIDSTKPIEAGIVDTITLS